MYMGPVDDADTGTNPAPRVVIPLTEPPTNRPRGSVLPCPACGEAVDALRAPRVILFEDGFRFLCSERCREQYIRGQRSEALRRPITPPVALRTSAGGIPSPVAVAPPTLTPAVLRRLMLAGGTCVALSALAGIFGRHPSMAIASAVMTAAASLFALWASSPSRKDVGALVWALGPIGAAGAGFGATEAIMNGGRSWLSLEGATLAAAAMLARAWFDAEARQPIADAVNALSADLPTCAFRPAASATDPLAFEQEAIDIARVRTGEDVIVHEGDVVPVDGVVQAGDAQVLPFLDAQTSVRRHTGDAILAGARIVTGTVRMLATRVGDDRAVTRVARFGDGSRLGRARVAFFADVVTRWGGVATLAVAAIVFWLADEDGLASPAYAASAVLLAAPLLALKRAAESPLVAGAAAAGARGIVYRDAESMEAAGRVAIAALSPHGTLTEGQPEVVELHPVGTTHVDELIALAAGAESAADDPIARAILKYARAKRVDPAGVRRITMVAGLGVTAVTPAGEALVVGSRRLLLSEGVGVALADAEAGQVEANGRIAVFIAVGGRVRGFLTLQDNPRQGARAAVQRLFDIYIEVVLLTGNPRSTIKTLATTLDIAHVKAELLPEERGLAVSNLRDAGRKVAVLGRPGDDNAALAAADVAITLGAAGGSGAERAISLVGHDLRDAAAALWIARAARDATTQSIRIAALSFAVVVTAAASGLIVPGLAATVTVAVDAYAVRAGARLLRRIALRLPALN
jgi:P-type E1-E2 ATPase